ncbi:S8 family peptidase [Paenibacillus kyungheensis]
MDLKGNKVQNLKVGIIDVGIIPHPNLNIHNLSDSWSKELGHGTMVASIIGASPTKINMYKGLIPGINIYAYNLNSNFKTEDLVKGIHKLVDADVSVINLSISSRKFDKDLKIALDWAISKKVIFVASAGNTSREENLYPSSYNSSGIISVGSLDDNYGISNFSTYNKNIDFFFAGENILSIGPNSNRISEFSGSSVAVPFVTALVVLTRAYLNESSSDIYNYLKSHSKTYIASWKLTNRVVNIIQINTLFKS